MFDELERRDIIAPIVQAKLEAEQKQGKGKEAEPKAGSGFVAVSHADLLYSTAKCDLDLARQALQQAKRSLVDGKFELADSALLALQSRGVLFEVAELDLPLEEVADNLKLAEAEIKAGRNEEARAALHVAMDELKTYEKQAGEKRGAEVKALHQEIDKVATELGQGKLSSDDQEKHASKISEWWQKTTKWMKGKAK